MGSRGRTWGSSRASYSIGGGVLDMPLSDIPEGTPAKRAESLRAARYKILDKAQRKFLFEFHDQNMPTGLIVKDGQHGRPRRLPAPK